MYESTAVVGERGQITIPKTIREKEGLKAKDKVIVKIENDRIIVEKSLSRKEKEDLMKEYYQKYGKLDKKLAKNGNLQAKKRTRCWMIIKRGDILLVNLEPSLGSEQGKIRPCLVVQNDTLNQFSPNTIIVSITSAIPDKKYPHTVIISRLESGLEKESTILCSQIRTISIEDRILKKLGSLEAGTMQKVNEALKTSLALE